MKRIAIALLPVFINLHAIGPAGADVDFAIDRIIETDIEPHSVLGMEYDGGWGIVIGLNSSAADNLISVPSIDDSAEGDFHFYSTNKEPRVMRARDIARNDGLPDLLITNTRQSLYSWASNGDGTFDVWGDSGWSDDITVGDAIPHDENDRDYVLLGVIKDENRITSQAGDGDNPPAGTERQIDVEDCPMDIATADIGGSAFIDLMVVNMGTDSLTILINTGLTDDNNTLTVIESQIEDIGDAPIALLAGNFDGQGSTDLVVLNRGDDTGEPGVTLIPEVSDVGAFSPLDVTPVAFVSADFDEDGDPDLAVLGEASGDAGPIVLFLNTGDGSFKEGSRYLVPGKPVSLDAVYLEGDDRPDLVVATQPEGVYVLRSTLIADVRTFAVKKGERLGGKKRHLAKSDDKRMRIESQFRQGKRRPYVMDLRTTHRSPLDDPALLHVEVEASLSEPAGKARIYLKNTNTGKWDRIAKYAAGLNEKTRLIADIEAADYIADGEIRVRIVHDMTTTSDGDPFRSFVDLVEVTVE